ncbi:unnamed protein product [Linum trigynum]|uniref:Uncharacterized protein n=1 Tax=Linum trigynum TaxID=586398 RepID=A0AAV2GS16_9ROSI
MAKKSTRGELLFKRNYDPDYDSDEGLLQYSYSYRAAAAKTTGDSDLCFRKLAKTDILISPAEAKRKCTNDDDPGYDSDEELLKYTYHYRAAAAKTTGDDDLSFGQSKIRAAIIWSTERKAINEEK